jgi:hypothetical protein
MLSPLRRSLSEWARIRFRGKDMRFPDRFNFKNSVFRYCRGAFASAQFRRDWASDSANRIRQIVRSRELIVASALPPSRWPLRAESCFPAASLERQQSAYGCRKHLATSRPVWRSSALTGGRPQRAHTGRAECEGLADSGPTSPEIRKRRAAVRSGASCATSSGSQSPLLAPGETPLVRMTQV